MLVRELPNARLVQASSILELRLTPERLTGEIVEFVGECFKPARAPGRGAERAGRRGGPAPVRYRALLAFRLVSHRREQKGSSAASARTRAPGACGGAGKKLVGYGAAALLALPPIIVLVLLGRRRRRRRSRRGAPSDVLPGGRQIPRAGRLFDVDRPAAGRGLRARRARGTRATTRPPWTSGSSTTRTRRPPAALQIPAEDGVYGRGASGRGRSSIDGARPGDRLGQAERCRAERAPTSRADGGRRLPDVPRAAAEHALRGGGDRVERRPAAERHRAGAAALRRGDDQDLTTRCARSATSTARRALSRSPRNPCIGVPARDLAAPRPSVLLDRVRVCVRLLASSSGACLRPGSCRPRARLRGEAVDFDARAARRRLRPAASVVSPRLATRPFNLVGHALARPSRPDLELRVRRGDALEPLAAPRRACERRVGPALGGRARTVQYRLSQRAGPAAPLRRGGRPPRRARASPGHPLSPT